MKTITIKISPNEVKVNIGEVDNFTELLVALATFEGVIGGVMNADKAMIRLSVDEIQKELQTKLMEDKDAQKA